MVERRTLTPLVLVRIQVPQPIDFIEFFLILECFIAFFILQKLQNVGFLLLQPPVIIDFSIKNSGTNIYGKLAIFCYDTQVSHREIGYHCLK